jgi:Flp pilus assembly pilin Flp
LTHIKTTRKRRRAAQGTTEYLVVLGVIALGITAGVSAFGDELQRAFGYASARLRGAPTLQLSYVTVVRSPARHTGRSGASLARSSSMSIPGTFGSPATGQVKLSWKAPTSNENGSALTNLAGYRIYYGTDSGTYGPPVDIGTVTEFQLTGLEIGETYYFAISSYGGTGAESALSNEVSKVVTAE